MKSLIQEFGDFSSLGYAAGISLKGPWKGQDEIYKYIRSDLLSDGIKLIVPQQSHRPDIAYVNDPREVRVYRADGLLSRSNDSCLTISTADCLTLLLADPSSGLFGAVHIGWRGFVAGILEELFKRATDLGLHYDELYAFLGPSIGVCCFEVGFEVSALFDDEFVAEGNGKMYVDLRKATLRKLTSLGVRGSNIGGLSECSSCLSEKYYSYRRDGDSSIRMVSFIWKRQDEPMEVDF